MSCLCFNVWVPGPSVVFRSPRRASVLTQKYIIISAERGWETRGWKTGVCKDTREASTLPLFLFLFVFVCLFVFQYVFPVLHWSSSSVTWLYLFLSGKFFCQCCQLSVIWRPANCSCVCGFVAVARVIKSFYVSLCPWRQSVFLSSWLFWSVTLSPRVATEALKLLLIPLNLSKNSSFASLPKGERKREKV